MDGELRDAIVVIVKKAFRRHEGGSSEMLDIVGEAMKQALIYIRVACGVTGEDLGKLLLDAKAEIDQELKESGI